MYALVAFSNPHTESWREGIAPNTMKACGSHVFQFKKKKKKKKCLYTALVVSSKCLEKSDIPILIWQRLYIFKAQISTVTSLQNKAKNKADPSCM